MAKSIPAGLLAEAGSILVVKPSSLGDIVHTLPSLAAICDAHPHLEARWVVNAGWEPLLAGHPRLDEVISFPRKELRGLGALPKFLRWSKDFRKESRKRPEVVLDFQGLLRSALISRARRSGDTVGLSDAREGALRFYRHVVEVEPDDHAVARYLRIPVGLGVEIPEPGALEFALPPGEPMGDGVKVPDRFVLFHPYSRGSGKSLSAGRIAEFCRALEPVEVVLVGQREMGDRTGESHGGANVTDLTNRTTLPHLIALMRDAAFTVSVDSGPMHLAAAVDGARTLGIHTWTDPRKVGPYHPEARVWKAGEIRAFDAWEDREAALDVAPDAEAIRLMAEHVLGRIGGVGGL